MNRSVTTNIQPIHAPHGASGGLSSVTRFMAESGQAGLSATHTLLRRFRRDEGGTFAIIAALTMPVLIGIVGLGAEVSLWHTLQTNEQNAADSAALTAATAYYTNASSSTTTYAQAVAASYGFTNGADGVTITVNRPPSTGNYTSQSMAVEVIIRKTQGRLLSKLWAQGNQTIVARSVAYATGGGGCVMALNGSVAKSVVITGTTNVNLIGCSLLDNSSANPAVEASGSGRLNALSVESVGSVSGTSNITTTNGINTGVSPALDPYADVPIPTPPSGGCQNPGNGTPAPNTFYCKLDFQGNSNVTLSPGIYFIGKEGMKVNGGATLSGTGVTLVFVQDRGGYGQLTFDGGANINLTAPTTGPTAGMAIFADRNMPVGTDFKFNGGSTMNITGAIYAPKAHLVYDGGANSPTNCTQLIGDTITFNGNSNIAVNCQGKGTKAIASAVSKLVE